MSKEKITNNLAESKAAGLFQLTPDQVREIEHINKDRTVGSVTEDNLLAAKEKQEDPPVQDPVEFTETEVEEVEGKDPVVIGDNPNVTPEEGDTTEIEPKSAETEDYSSIIRTLISDGDFADLEVISGEDEETKINLSEMENVDKSFLLDIIKEQTKIQKDSLKDSYISIEGISETRKNLAEIILRGTEDDILAIQSNPHLINDPYEGYDLSNTDHLYSILVNNYITEGNLSESKARLLATQSLKDGTLDSEVSEIITRVNQDKIEALNKIKTDRITQQLEDIQKTKDLRKGMLTHLKDKGLDSVKATKYANMATEKNSGGDFKIDDLYFEWASNPEKMSKLVHFMMDEEDYVKRATFKTKVITTGKELRQITRTNTASAKASEKTVGSKNTFRFSDNSKIM